jgi:UPF0755 protein
MKKVFLIALVVLLVLGGAAAWMFLGSGTGFNEEKRTLYIRSDAATKKAVLDSLQENKIISNTSVFNWLAGRMDLWSNLKPGKYDIRKGSSVLAITRKLRNGQQTPVNLVITKLRTKEDFARLAGNRFECDSAQMIAFLNNGDSLRPFETDPEQAMTLVLPDTYTFFWNTTPEKIYAKLAQEAKRFWTDEREKKAAALGLTYPKAYILASIVEEETNNNEEKDTIASVYLNRVAKGMPLQADPTVKFALKNFSLTRIYGEHLNTVSPYNTYRNRGLPPGPICTPSKKTIDAVLAAPQTGFVYFVANKQLNGTHSFSTTYAEHMVKAREYQEAYRQWAAARQQKRAGN